MWKSYGPGGGYFGMSGNIEYDNESGEGCCGGCADENLSEFLECQKHLIFENLSYTDEQYLNENNLERKDRTPKTFACHEADDLRSEAGADGDDGQRCKAHEVNGLGHRLSELLKFTAGVEIIQMRNEDTIVGADDGDEDAVKFRCRCIKSHGFRATSATEVDDVEGGVEGEENHVDAHGEDGKNELSHAAEAKTEADVTSGVTPVDESIYYHLCDGDVEVSRIVIVRTNKDEDTDYVEKADGQRSQRDVAEILHALKEPLDKHDVEENLCCAGVIEFSMLC